MPTIFPVLPGQVKTGSRFRHQLGWVSDDLQAWLQQNRWDIGRRIRDLRLARGLTQIQIGDHAGLDNKTISRLENGVYDTPLSYYLRVARALEVPPWRLFRDD